MLLQIDHQDHTTLNIKIYTVSYTHLEAFDCARKQGIMRQTIQDHELKEIEEKFEQLKVSNVALKGSFLKQYYPSKDMRLLTDLYRLFKSEEKEKMQDVYKRQKQFS